MLLDLDRSELEQLGCFPGKVRGSGFGFSRKRSRLHSLPTPGPAAAVAHRTLADVEPGDFTPADHASIVDAKAILGDIKLFANPRRQQANTLHE